MSQQQEDDNKLNSQTLHNTYTPHIYTNQKPSNQTPFDFNQSVTELFSHQNELTHSTQHLTNKQQML